MERGRALVGTSGFAFDAWRGSFYPAGLPASRMLSAYASRIPSVEINYTFRRQPTDQAVLRWRERTPEGFVFALKAPALITHMRRLLDAGDEAATFVATADLLGDRLGPILFQLHPNFEADPDRLRTFLDALPGEHRYAMEFRHPSWEATFPLLAERGVAWCASETNEAPLDAVPAGPFGYLRLRRPDYTDADLAVWAARLRPVLDGGTDVHVYLKHEEGGLGATWALRLLELLEGTPSGGGGGETP